MTRFPNPEAAGSRPCAGSADAVREAMQIRPNGTLVPFPVPAARRRRAPSSGERRGEILFFLGVRYERLAS